MADDEDDLFSFGDFKFAPFQSHINGVTSPSKPHDIFHTASFSEFNSSINTSNSTRPTSGSSSIRVDANPINVQKPNGGLPFSLFGEIEGEGEGGSNNKSNGDLIGWFDPNPSLKNGNLYEDHKKDDGLIDSKNGFSLDFNGVPSDLILGNNTNGFKKNDNNNGEGDNWEFAFSGNGNIDQGNLKGGGVVNGSTVEPLAMRNQEKQAGQDALKSVNPNPGSLSYLPQSTDFFTAPFGNGVSEMDDCLKSSTNTMNGFMWDPFPVVENMGNGNEVTATSVIEDDDFDDFGDFVVASQEIVSKDQEPVVTQMSLDEPQLFNGEVQEKQTQTGPIRGALPLSIFGDDTEESSDSLNIQNELVLMPTLSSVNSFSGQGSAISIQDLISNLYSQTQLSSTNSVGKSAENGVHFPSNTAVTTLDEDKDEDEEWGDDSWEFKGALSSNVVGEQLSTASPENIAQKESVTFSELESYTEFYDQLRSTLCLLLSCQLDELKKAQSSDAVTGNGEQNKALDDEFQEAFKLLDENVISKEAFKLSMEFDRYHCLDKFVEVLQGPKLNMIGSDFPLLKRLQLATNDWRIAAELLRHAISMQKVLCLGSADEQSLYTSTWSKILNVCIQELRCGTLIWKRALENNVKHHILSDSRGQQYILALGEIYKVVALLRLSAKVYKPWILRNSSESSKILAGFDECDILWSNSGLEEALQISSNDFTLGCSETAKTVIASIKNIRDVDLFTVHDRVLSQHKSLCRLCLLPLETIDDLKTVVWGEEAYFLNIANLWANLISCNPPQLPHLETS